jgi:hypothetical protein
MQIFKSINLYCLSPIENSINLNSMNSSLSDLSLVIKKEADDILFERGLLNILHSFGEPHVSGSYTLGLMTWRDLDIYLEADDFSTADFFLLGSKICSLLSPVKMSYRNELIAKTNGLPAGLYWGIYLGNERAGAWKIDIWAVSTPECQQRIKYCTEIEQKLTPETIAIILEIKSLCWQDPAYRRSYSSATIYDAVLEKNITGIEAFRTYLGTKK